MKVITAVVNNPTFIEIQYHTLRKYLHCEAVDSYEFIVFNDAKTFPDFTNDGDLTLRTQITETCRALGIQCIDIPNDHHQTQLKSAIRCADSMNYMLRYQLAHPDKYLLLDSDMFLIADLDITKYFSYDCAVLLQSRPDWQLNYIWNGIYYFDIPKMKHLHLMNWNEGGGGDVGGMMASWLRAQMAGALMPSTDALRWNKEQTFHTSTIYFIKHLWSCSWNESEMPVNLKTLNHYPALLAFLKQDGRNPENGNFFCEIYDEVFLHYRAGGNWNEEGMAMHNALSTKLKQALL